MMTKTIIFDYDGTIHHTLGIYEPAFRETYQWLTEQKVTEEREIGSVEIAGWLGLNSKEMWNTFLPELDQSYKEQASRMVGDLMVRLLQVHKSSMANTSTSMKMEAKLRVVLLRMQMVLIASTMLQQVNAWLMNSSQQATTIGTTLVLMVRQ